jgi:23S rRNA (cytidine1920-2'-O)/16S rRNA (cytidine1409-2'-O)-methyltransferase
VAARPAGSRRRNRLDAELVRRGLARSRADAGGLIETGRVSVAGIAATKAATQVDPDTSIVVNLHDDPGWASRGAYKLEGALNSWPGVVVHGRRCLDAGASTGGFTDVLLRRGAAEVVAVDVGYGQLVWRLRADPRVVVLDRTNVRNLSADDVGGPVQLVVADLSFISLRLVLPALRACADTGADLLLMVKPQFEVGRAALRGSGVVRDPALRSEAVRSIASSAYEIGLGTADVTASSLPGPSGNVEYFVWLRDDAPPPDPELIERAVQEGPV